MSNIAIAGMGWLGIPLAGQLQQLGHGIKGSTTSKEKQKKLKANGLDAYRVEIGEDGINGQIASFLEDISLLIILIPPGLRKNTGHNHALRMLQLLKAVETSAVEKVILISSTGVYEDQQGKVDERTAPEPETMKSKQLLEAEQIFSQSEAFKTTIIRFGGLYGGSRNPVKYLAGRKDLKNGNAPVNLIHRVDCINIILAVIYKNAFGYTFNAVAPQHPSKAEYYKEQALKNGMEPPQYLQEEPPKNFKQIDSVNVKEVLGYEFQVAL